MEWHARIYRATAYAILSMVRYATALEVVLRRYSLSGSLSGGLGTESKRLEVYMASRKPMSIVWPLTP